MGSYLFYSTPEQTVDKSAGLTQPLFRAGFLLLGNGKRRFLPLGNEKRRVIEPLVDAAATQTLMSVLESCWDDELGVRECRLEGPSIWESAGEKWWADCLGVGNAVVEDDDGLFVFEGRPYDKMLRVVGRSPWLFWE